jgi:hypothetical protein
VAHAMMAGAFVGGGNSAGGGGGACHGRSLRQVSAVQHHVHVAPQELEARWLSMLSPRRAVAVQTYWDNHGGMQVLSCTAPCRACSLGK